jgi:hypothetical protein
MRLTRNTGFFLRRFLLVLPVIILLTISQEAKAQEPPPRPISVTWTSQNLSFGAFYQGATGGSVIINSAGGRSSTGDVVLLSMGYLFSAAVFNVVANPGTVISLLKPTTTLTDGSGHLLTLQIDETSPVSPFVTTVPVTSVTPVYVGGILYIGSPAANPPGDYTGTFDMTFVQE